MKRLFVLRRSLAAVVVVAAAVARAVARAVDVHVVVWLRLTHLKNTFTNKTTHSLTTKKKKKILNKTKTPKPRLNQKTPTKKRKHHSNGLPIRGAHGARVFFELFFDSRHAPCHP